ncbi:MAG: ABC transporter ATP-binding protein [Halomonas sp.]|nr:ABC transporter ATP-binding protein [Halomonas sp.]
MSLHLQNIAHTVGGVPYISDVDLALEPGSFNVLLGRTLAGKTTLMRLMAGLEPPTKGRIVMDGKDVTGVPVRHRNVSMVYQQFINYPSLTVYDNIASPLHLAKHPKSEIDKRVGEIAEMLHIEHLLDRYPLELSGGQQQRTAMGRALVKELALGGNTAVLHEGKLLQYGPTDQIYRQPNGILSAEMFSEPPINIVPGRLTENDITFDNDTHFACDEALRKLPPGDYQFGVRASHLSLTPQADDDLELPVTVDVAEISGSETFLHAHHVHFPLVLHLLGIHELKVNQAIKVYFPTHKLFVFDQQGQIVHTPLAQTEGVAHG